MNGREAYMVSRPPYMSETGDFLALVAVFTGCLEVHGFLEHIYTLYFTLLHAWALHVHGLLFYFSCCSRAMGVFQETMNF